MPNWCFNSVQVSADTEAELKEFIEFATQSHTSRHINIYSKEREVIVDENAKGVFWNFITPPVEIQDEYFGEQPRVEVGVPVNHPDFLKKAREERKKSNHWYDWNIENWDTKWDVQLEPERIEIQQNPSDNSFFFIWQFDTAWSPATCVYYKMAERFPNLHFEFEITEEANFYAARLIFKDGQPYSEDWADNPTKADYERLEIPCPEWLDEETA